MVFTLLWLQGKRYKKNVKVEVIGTFTIKGRDILSEDGKTLSRIVELKDEQGRDASVIQFFEKQ